ncbi:MAG: sodium:solute symporter [Planctomycetota bacterium]|nr:MAG: sodium:solute symporter [Planctomycetota bacterium]
MGYFNNFDYGIILFYFSFLICLGFYLQRRAAKSLDDYFLGGKQLPWWALGVSGMAWSLDITGTMLIVSFLYMIGPRGLFIEFRSGANLALIFMMLWTGKWHRRSGCMTGAEWNIYRFGTSAGGQIARIVSACVIIFSVVGMLGYMVKGVGIFLNTFFDFPPFYCAIVLVSIATLYTICSGFYGVVYTDLFQAGIILAAVVGISILAINNLTDYGGKLTDLATQVTGNELWTSSVPHLHTEMPKGYEEYNWLALIAGFYLLRNIMAGISSGGDSRYFGARNERDCGKLTFLWSCLMTFRWPMMMGFAVMGLLLVNRLFPDQKPIAESCDLLKQQLCQKVTEKEWDEGIDDLIEAPDRHQDLVTKLKERLGEQSWQENVQQIAFHEETDAKTTTQLDPDAIRETRSLIKQNLIPENRWNDDVADIINHPEKYPELVAKLKAKVGEKEWKTKVKLVGYHRTVNMERMLPTVLLTMIPAGFRGLLFIALLAASMSTFDYHVNWASAFFTKDIYQAYIHPKAKNRELIIASYTFGLLIVVCGFTLGYKTKTIHGILNWIVMGLGAGVALPGILRLYWWRFNAGGVIIGTIVGMISIIVQAWFFPHWNTYIQFTVLTVVSLTGTIAGTYMTPPTDRKTLEHFYKTTRPFGLWGPFKKCLSPEQRAATKRENFYDVICLPIGLTWQVCMFLLPMQLVIGTYRAFGITLFIWLICLYGLYKMWYKNLPPAREGVENPGMGPGSSPPEELLG